MHKKRLKRPSERQRKRPASSKKSKNIPMKTKNITIPNSINMSMLDKRKNLRWRKRKNKP